MVSWFLVRGRRMAGFARLFSAFSALSAFSAFSALSAQTRDWPPRDRAVIGDFTRITAVAASVDRVYATTPTTLLIWKPQFRQWDGPYTPTEPGTLDRVFGGMIDPLDNSLWLARADGWSHYNPDIQLWERGTVGGLVQEIAFDADRPESGLLIRTTTGWFSVPRGSLAAVPAIQPRRLIRMSTPNDAVRSNPSLSANSSSILLNGRLHAARYTAASPGFAQRGWYLGTSGVGLLFFDEGAPLPQRLIFGLPGDDIGALYEAPGGMWVVNQPTATSDAGLSFVANDLSDFRWFQGPGTRGYPFTQARRLVGIQRSLWAATDVGLVRFDPTTGDYDVLNEGAGLPDRRVLDIAVRRGRIAVGTMHGVVVFDDSLKVTRLAPSFTDAIRAVALSGDTVWVGTDVGLAIAVPGADNLLQPEALRESPSLQAPVVSLLWDRETLVALTDDRLMWRNPQTGAFQLGASLSGQLGRLHTLLPYRDGFWVAGDRGVGFARRNTPVVRPIQSPGDLPAPVTSLAIDDTYLWVGTRQGLVRFRLDAVGP